MIIVWCVIYHLCVAIKRIWLYFDLTELTTYSYPGATIPLIHSRVPHIFPKYNEPTTILLQCGGDDTVNRNPDPVIDQYEGLIKEKMMNTHVLLQRYDIMYDNALIQTFSLVQSRSDARTETLSTI